MKTVRNNTVVGESDGVTQLQTSGYFQPSGLAMVHVPPRLNNTVFAWRCMTSHFDSVMDGDVNWASYRLPSTDRGCR